MVLDEAAFAVKPVPVAHAVERIEEAVVVDDRSTPSVSSVVDGIERFDRPRVQHNRREIKWHRPFLVGADVEWSLAVISQLILTSLVGQH